MGFYEGVNKANDGLDNIVNLISTKKEFLIKQVVNSILLFVILLVFGCLDFATLTFHAEYLLTASYWGTIGTKLIAAICAFNVGINMMLDNEIKKSKELARNIALYNHLIRLKDTDFEEFVVHYLNPRLKAKAYKNKINRQIYLLNKFSRRRDRLLYSSDLPENQEKKKKNRYCIKRAELEELKSDEYIQKNLDSIIVNYKEIDPAIFELEINGEQKSQGIKVAGSIISGRIKESTTIIFTMLAISMLTTSFGLSASKEEFENNMVAFWHYCLKAVEDTGIVLWQFLNGLLRARKIVSKELTQPYAGRNAVLEEYINWRNKNNAQESPVFQEIKTVQEKLDAQKEDYIEMTPEEYEAYKKQNK